MTGLCQQEGSRKTEEAARETMEAGRRSPYIIVIY